MLCDLRLTTRVLPGGMNQIFHSWWSQSSPCMLCAWHACPAVQAIHHLLSAEGCTINTKGSFCPLIFFTETICKVRAYPYPLWHPCQPSLTLPHPAPHPPPLAPICSHFGKVVGLPVQGIQCLDCRSFYEAVGTWGHEGEALPACGHVLPSGVCFYYALQARISQHPGKSWL